MTDDDDDVKVCEHCDGQGEVETLYYDRHGNLHTSPHDQECPNCQGTGEVPA